VLVTFFFKDFYESVIYFRFFSIYTQAHPHKYIGKSPIISFLCIGEEQRKDELSEDEQGERETVYKKKERNIIRKEKS
jgi:hypothetical protein